MSVGDLTRFRRLARASIQREAAIAEAAWVGNCCPCHRLCPFRHHRGPSIRIMRAGVECPTRMARHHLVAMALISLSAGCCAGV